jgi:predicted RNase H-like HicB family nuclease
MTLEIMFKSEKDAKCVRCQEPIPSCDYELSENCMLPGETDEEAEPCHAKLSKMQCPLALCFSCRLGLRRQAIMLNRMDKILIAESERTLKRPYLRGFVPEPNGQFSTAMPELLGCISCGDNLDDAYARLHEAALGWIASVIECGEDIPKPAMED